MSMSAPPATPECRAATPADQAAWRALWEAYLAFYGVTLAPGVTEATWARAMDPASPLGLRLALADGQVRGFAFWHWHLTTWSAAPDCYLEDLFVAEAARGHGLGRALIKDVQAVGQAMGCARLYWMTDQHNDRARALYDSFTPTDGHIRYRLSLSR